MSLIVVGSVALDNITNPHGQVKNILGGSASYFSCAAGNFCKVNLVGVVGRDFPKEYIDFLNSKNIDTSGLEVTAGNTFTWTGSYSGDLSAASTEAVALNVFETFNPVLSGEFKKSEYVFLANIAPALQKNVMKQLTRPKLVVMDTMNHWIDNSKQDLLDVIKDVDILILNEDEARMLTGEINIIKAGKKILHMGPSRVVVKKGGNGAFILSGNDYFCAPAYPLEQVIDTTGAGDTFAGGFVGYLAKTEDLSDKNMRKALIYGTVCASFTVEDFSVKKIGSISLKDIEERYNKFRSMMIF